MARIDVTDRAYRELELLVVAWHTTITETVDRLITTRAAARARLASHPVQMYVFYSDTDVAP